MEQGQYKQKGLSRFLKRRRIGSKSEKQTKEKKHWPILISSLIKETMVLNL